jgi:threonine-phosphate decarboxylase
MQVHGGDIYRNPDMLDFSANINPLGIPESVRLAAYQGVDLSEHYPDVVCEQLRMALAEYEKMDKEQFFCGNGAAEVIFSLVLAKHPKKALLMAPTFLEYEKALSLVKCQIKYHYLLEEQNFLLGESFLDKIDESIEMIFLCNPNNPTGKLIDKTLLMKILKVCDKYGCMLVIDECFLEFLKEHNDYSMAGYLKESKNLFILKAFTKIYAIPGLRLGYGMTSDDKVLKRMAEVVQPWNVSIPAQMAGIAALREKHYIEETYSLIEEQREWLMEEIRKLGMKVFDASANYLMFKGPEDLADRMKQKDILIRDCSNYKGLDKGFYRIAVRLPDENIQLLEVLKEVLGMDGE